MDFGRVLIVVLLATVAGSYTWGMRGTILGGEKGAMLPGAALGMIFAFACGSDAVSQCYAILAAAGSAAMFFGGAQTYGQTISLSYDRENKARRYRGRIGLTVKGAAWFGIFGGVIAVCLGAMAGRYTVAQLILFTVLLPVSKWLGFLVLNTPQKPREGKFPKFYFSEGRFEVWGGIVFVNIMIIIFALVKREWFVIIMTLAGLVSGGLGFFIGNHFQTATQEKREDGKYILGALQKNGYVGSWKMMEFTLGAVGGLGTSLCFCLCYNGFVSSYVTDILAKSGVRSPLSPTLCVWITYAWLILLLLYTVRYILPQPKPCKSEIDAKLKSGEISRQRYDVLLPDAVEEKPSKILKAIKDADEVVAWPIFSYIPMLLALLCNLHAARILSVFFVFWVLAEEMIFTPDYTEKIKWIKPIRVALGVAGLVLLLVQLFTGRPESAFIAWLLYCVCYEITELFSSFLPELTSEKIKEHGSFKKALLATKSSLSCRVYSLLCVLFMIAAGAFYFIT